VSTRFEIWNVASGKRAGLLPEGADSVRWRPGTDEIVFLHEGKATGIKPENMLVEELGRADSYWFSANGRSLWLLDDKGLRASSSGVVYPLPTSFSPSGLLSDQRGVAWEPRPGEPVIEGRRPMSFERSCQRLTATADSRPPRGNRVLESATLITRRITKLRTSIRPCC
jgi:hypothetical protein